MDKVIGFTSKASRSINGGYDAAQKLMDGIVAAPAVSCNFRDSMPLKIFTVAAIVGIAASVGSWRTFLSSAVYLAFFTVLIAWLVRVCHSNWAWTISIVFALSSLSMVLDKVLPKPSA